MVQPIATTPPIPISTAPPICRPSSRGSSQASHRKAPRKSVARSAPRRVPITEPTEKLGRVPVEVIRYRIARPTGAVKDGPSTCSPCMLSCEMALVPTMATTTASPTPAAQATVAGRRTAGCDRPQASSATAIRTATAVAGTGLTAATPCAIPEGPVCMSCGNSLARSGPSGPDRVKKDAIPSTITMMSDRMSPPPARVRAPKPQFPASAMP